MDKHTHTPPRLDALTDKQIQAAIDAALADDCELSSLTTIKSTERWGLERSDRLALLKSALTHLARLALVKAIRETRLPEEKDPHADNPATFEAHGFTWNRHTPGDPMPCDGKNEIFIIDFDNSRYGPMSAEYADDQNWWSDEYITPIIGWRYAAPAPVAEVKPAPFNESKWIWMMEWCRKHKHDASYEHHWTEAEKQFNANKEVQP